MVAVNDQAVRREQAGSVSDAFVTAKVLSLEREAVT